MRASNEVTIEERMAWARSDRRRHQGRREPGASRCATASPAPPSCCGAAPALSAVAAALRNEDLAVSREALDAVREFMTDGIDSPLYGRDPLAARRGADALRRLHRRGGGR